jgi:hypothetical protein
MLVVKREFRQTIGSAFETFKAGAVIENPLLERELLRTNSPVEVVVDNSDLIQCPHCKRKFTVRQAVAEEDDNGSDVCAEVGGEETSGLSSSGVVEE